jgi:hypothetical protein
VEVVLEVLVAEVLERQAPKILAQREAQILVEVAEQAGVEDMPGLVLLVGQVQ